MVAENATPLMQNLAYWTQKNIYAIIVELITYYGSLYEYSDKTIRICSAALS